MLTGTWKSSESFLDETVLCANRRMVMGGTQQSSWIGMQLKLDGQVDLWWWENHQCVVRYSADGHSAMRSCVDVCGSAYGAIPNVMLCHVWISRAGRVIRLRMCEDQDQTNFPTAADMGRRKAARNISRRAKKGQVQVFPLKQKGGGGW